MIPFYEIQPSDLNIIHNERELYFRPHIHKHIEILYVYEGGQHLRINNKEYEVNEGEAAVIFPNLQHNYFRTETRKADEILLICSPAMFGSVFPNLTNCLPENPVVSRENISPDAVFAFRELKKDNSLSINLGWALIVMSRLLEHMTLKSTEHIPIENITYQLIEYITKNFTHPLSLDVLAKEFHVSKYYISHIFSEKIGVNFRHYIGAIRAEYAASLLRSTDENITAVCEMSGFDSLRSFNRIFRAVYNMSPREYRNNINAYLKNIQ